MTALERFLRYVTYDTQSSETSETTPSTPKQRLLGKALAQELQDLGLEGAHLAENGAVYAWLPATPEREEVPVLALIAHMDTAPRVPSENVQARVVHYEGGDLVLNQEKGIVTTLKEFPDLAGQVGKDLVVTDGTTLLGADDKAGVAEILTAMEHLLAHPERPHGRVALCFTPDEEVGTGADYVDLDKLGADFGYTVDGGPLGGLEYENFNAAEVDVLFHGEHPPGGGEEQTAQRLPDGRPVHRHGAPGRVPRPHRGVRGLLPPVLHDRGREPGPAPVAHPGPRLGGVPGPQAHHGGHRVLFGDPLWRGDRGGNDHRRLL